MSRIFPVILILFCTKCMLLWKIMKKIRDNIQFMFSYHNARISFQVSGWIQHINSALNIRCDAHLINVMKCRWQILCNRDEQSRTIMQLCNTLQQSEVFDEFSFCLQQSVYYYYKQSKLLGLGTHICPGNQTCIFPFPKVLCPMRTALPLSWRAPARISLALALPSFTCKIVNL